MRVRTRFAPSPTGPLHMGNARTALFSYLFAKKERGDFVVRVEDTAKERSKPEWEKDVLENLEWLGLSWDEGPTKAGDKGSFGPYRQSERTKIYKEYLEKLLKEKKAYWCFCTQEELEAQRQDQTSRGETPRYSGRCRTLSLKEQEQNKKTGKPAAIRFVVEPKKITFKDLIRGEVSFDMTLSGDIVIAKNLKTPLYNFTVVVDDELMRITHVIRGEDHISNTPKQQLIRKALGFKQEIKYAHLPLILGEDKTKLSKRHGDNSVTRFRKEGYLPEAIVNFLALLGWNPGDEREIFSLQGLVKEFSLDRVQKGNAVFNLQRLDWINGFYLRQKDKKTLVKLAIPYLKEAGLLEVNGNGEQKKFSLRMQKSHPYAVKETGEGIGPEFLGEVVNLYQERLKKLSEIAELADFFFKKELNYEKELLRWKNMEEQEIAESLEKSHELLLGLKEGDWNKEKIEQILLKEAEAGGKGKLLWPLRVALTGKKASAGPFEVASVLGKEKTLQRIKQAMAKLQQTQKPSMTNNTNNFNF
ncbi:glutamate--tRNA ligase [Patescibacteria group bacterium]|nr:glutamate--tRNA ligase [Patescibacteria group bacterium]